MNNINNIRYLYTINNQSINYLFNTPIVTDLSHLVELKPANFNYKCMNLLEPKKNWFINTSDISKDVIDPLEEGFCLLTLNKDRNIIECIKSVENNFYRHRLYNNNTFRNKLFSLIKDIKNFHNSSKLDLDIFSVSSTKEFVFHNPDVILTRADKGNTVVALDRVDYTNKMEISLSDTVTLTCYFNAILH